MIGTRFHYLVVVASVVRYGKKCWLVRCDCGTEKTATTGNLRRGQKSCGCKTKEILRLARTRHGDSKPHNPRYRTWQAWKSMLDRCFVTSRHDWDKYGGRGIKVCERWMTYENFREDMGVRPQGFTLDRINGDGNYEPSNCRWATVKEQANNRKSNHWLEWNGAKKTLMQWAEERGIPFDTLHNRIKSGWSADRALTSPLRIQRNSRHVDRRHAP